MRKVLTIVNSVAIVLMVLVLASCGSGQAEPLVRLETTEGNVTLRLFKETPKHRDNFVQLVKEGYYDGLLFHDVQRGFLLQSGDPKSKDARANRRLGSGGPGYTVESEIDTALSDTSKRFCFRGALVAGRLPDDVNVQRASNGSQFFIVTGTVYSEKDLDSLEQAEQARRLDVVWQKLVMVNRDKINALLRDSSRAQALQDSLAQVALRTMERERAFRFTKEQRRRYTTVGGVPALDGLYTVFGEVVEGMDVVERIERVKVDAYHRPVKDVRIVKAYVVK